MNERAKQPNLYHDALVTSNYTQTVINLGHFRRMNVCTNTLANFLDASFLELDFKSIFPRGNILVGILLNDFLFLYWKKFSLVWKKKLTI